MSVDSAKLALCNRALSQLGIQELASLTEMSSEGKKTRLLFDPLWREVLHAGLWSCALRWATLTPVTLTTPDGCPLANVFPLPTDCVRVSDVEPADIEYCKQRFPASSWAGQTVAKDVLRSSEPSLKVKYVSLITPDLADELLAEAFIARLASALALSCLKDANAANLLESQYRRIILPQTRYYAALEQRSHKRAYH